MHLGLIGMSGIGKSHWAERLSEAGYTPLHCDSLIAERLSAELGLSLSSLADLGMWMGMPHEPGFAARERRYLDHEAAVLRAITAELSAADERRRYVVDMTGSAIYMDPALLEQVRSHLTTVHLQITPRQQAQLLRIYLAQPRPVIWGDCYRPQPGETPEQTLARCYADLIEQRLTSYHELADVELPYELHREGDLSVPRFLQLVRSADTGPTMRL